MVYKRVHANSSSWNPPKEASKGKFKQSSFGIQPKSELSRKVIMDWIEKALNQNRGLPETHEPSWNTFFISAVRARIFDEKHISDRSTFWENPEAVFQI